MAKKKVAKMLNGFARTAIKKLGYMTYGAIRAPAATGMEWIADKAGVGDKYRAIGVVDEATFIFGSWAMRKAIGRRHIPFISDILDAPKSIEWARFGEVGRDKIIGMVSGKSANDIFGGN